MKLNNKLVSSPLLLPDIHLNLNCDLIFVYFLIPPKLIFGYATASTIHNVLLNQGFSMAPWWSVKTLQVVPDCSQ